MNNDPHSLDIGDDTGIEKTGARAATAGLAMQQPPRTRGRTRQTAAREPTRGEVLGRNGEVLTRKRTAAGDIFNIPSDMIEPGWEFQWIALSVVGNTEVVMDQNLMMLENGWRPVAASRFPGRFMPEGHTGHIVRGGQGLYERPKVLCDQARREDVRNAKQLMTDQNESLKLAGMGRNLPDGFNAPNQQQRRRYGVGEVRMNIDPGLYYDDQGGTQEIQRPQHQLADPGE